MKYSDATGWVRPRPDRAGVQADAILAVALAVGASSTSLLYARTGIFTEIAPPWLWVIGLTLVSLPLALRRRYPVPVAIVVGVGFFICGQFAVPETLMVNICLFIALYTIGAWESNRQLAVWSLILITLVMIIWLVVSLIISSSDSEWLPNVSRSGLFSAFATFAVLQIIMNLMYFAGAYFFGMNSWRAAHTRAVLEAQGKELELERRTSAEQAVALDRLSIARELHDVVAHHVSVMGVQAAAARMSLDRDPQAAKQALEFVEEAAHTTVSELRSLVTTLRSPESDSPGSTLGVAQFPGLVAESQLAGIPTTFIVAGEPRSLPLLVDVTLYRVAQEALTNVRKHAGRGASAEVRLRFYEDRVELEVTDDGVRQLLAPLRSGGSPAPGQGGLGVGMGAGAGVGVGLRGMRERLGAVGGTLETARREATSVSHASGFLVRASVPLGPLASDSASPNFGFPKSAGPDTTSPDAQNEEALS